MLGKPVTMPVAIAPAATGGMQIADGEIKAARATEKYGIPFTLSTMSVCSIEDIAENTTAPFWFQLYVMRDRAFIERLIDRAKAAKCSALVLTLDLQIQGQRHREAGDLRRGGLAREDLAHRPGCLVHGQVGGGKHAGFGSRAGIEHLPLDGDAGRQAAAIPLPPNVPMPPLIRANTPLRAARSVFQSWQAPQRPSAH